MSKLRVNELDTRSGTTITVASGKTIAGTDIIDTAQIAANAVDTSEIAANAVTLAEMAGLTRGSIIIGDSGGDPSALTKGTADQVLTSDGSDLSWGTIDTGLTWEAVQTSAFTAVAGKAYPVNTTAAAITVTLPASPSAGDEVLILDYAGTFDTNAVTVGNNGSNIMGDTSTVRFLLLEYQATRFRFVDATGGWFPLVNSSGADLSSPLYVAATGPDEAAGTIDGDYKYHIFNASKTGVNAFNVSSVGNALGSNTVEYLAIAGGGGGGGQHGGGGGAGGYLNDTSYTLSGGVGFYDVTLGAGGAESTGSASTMPAGGDGTNTVWAGNQPGGITCTGGGGGGAYRQPAASPGISDGRDGGSGGGGGSSDNGSGFSGVGGSATAGQGTDGGKGRYSGGGGGGSGGAGGNAEPDPWGPTTSSLGGAGGVGFSNDITASGVFRGGGGGGGAYNNTTGGGAGGNGGGAAGSSAGGHPGGTPAVAATANTGGGGGGGALGGSTSASNGGSGVVIIRYKFQ